MQLSPSVSHSEQETINTGINSLINAGRIELRTDSQIMRVVHAAKGSSWLTLRDLERRITRLYGVPDTQAAISARLREINSTKHGLTKEKTKLLNKNTGKYVYFYRLVPLDYKEV